MSDFARMAGWSLALMALAGCAVLGFMLIEARGALADEAAMRAQLEQEMKTLEQRMLEAPGEDAEEAANNDEELKRLRQENEELASALEEARQMNMDLNASLARNGGVDPAGDSPMPEPAAEVNTGEEGEAERPDRPRRGGFPFANMSREQRDRMASMGAKMAVDMQYQDFLTGLNLPLQTQEQVRDILVAHQTAMQRAGMAQMSGEESAPSPEDMQAMQEGVRQQLAGVIGQDGLAAYDQYQQELPYRNMERQVDMQLSNMAGNLAGETRDMVTNVVVEEMQAAGAIMDPNAMMTNPEEARNSMGNMVQLQQEAYARALERLSPALTDEEYVAVDRFVARQMEMMQVMGDMMREQQEQNNVSETPQAVE